MPTKNKTKKAKASNRKPVKSYKQQFEQLEKSIVLFVLSNPRLEHEIVHNYLTRNGYVVGEETTSDQQLFIKYGVPLPDKKELVWREEKRSEAVNLHRQSQKLRVEIEAKAQEE